MKPISLRLLARDMNLETSQTVMAGPYLTPEARERLAVDRLAQTLAGCTAQSKTRMANNEEPTCLVDFGCKKRSGKSPPRKKPANLHRLIPAMPRSVATCSISSSLLRMLPLLRFYGQWPCWTRIPMSYLEFEKKLLASGRGVE
ncbi:hypothetical protein GH714_026968 [Hevea brasiliensis]|uniref:Uncharacterized protein n=1 Tax=Hevea brasiliensis TaxID=3981 RepID=A0A6A6MH48_HEVBR|nr:hypothetical protein GH714_026968 [Hevea brasiliensis]